MISASFRMTKSNDEVHKKERMLHVHMCVPFIVHGREDFR